MNLDQVRKKLREAQFFFSKMQDEERERFGPEEPFEFYLSAFLSAAKAVAEVLIFTEKSSSWYKTWRDNLGTDKKFIKCMENKRDAEVHRKGAGQQAKIGQKELQNTHLDQSTTSFVLIGAPHGVPLGTYDIKEYYFTIDGSEQSASAACAKYLASRVRMVTEFETDHPAAAG